MRTEEIQSGMRLARDVHDPHGQILIRAGIVLGERQIQALKSWGVAEVVIVPDEDTAESGICDPKAIDEIRRSIDTQFSLSNGDHPVIQALHALCLDRALARSQGSDYAS
ncbi:hypothetical protein [Allochromatium palmeri]|uniref:Uncharacterized protein n=1 Tax=Allochromatium palmeri TaxID=231048 RepID=A0A6N8E700_9GAMM|nr:hypothetical protein [Allochromatium palmeri]MTW19895.1 hypothetical protein [Allochromatium palmeri]